MNAKTQGYRVMYTHFFVLQKNRVRLLINASLRSGSGDGVKNVFLGVLGTLFVLGDYWFFHRILFYFNGLPVDVGEILIIQLLNLLCLTFFSMLVFSNIITSISTMYMSRDLDFLISLPIPVTSIFISRLVLTLVNSSWMAVLFSLPVFIAYGQVNYAPWEYYLTAPALLVPFIMIPSGVGTLATMLLIRFFPARRVYQALSFLGLVFIGGLVIFFRFMEPEKFLGKDVPDEAIIGFVEKMKAPDYPWLPSSMMASSLQSGSFGDWPAFWIHFLYLCATALVVTAITVVIASRIYYRGWSSAYGSERLASMPGRERALYRAVRWFLRGVNSDARALIMKDVKLFWRDTGQWSQLLMLGALIIVYIFNIRNLPLNTFYIKNVVSIMNIGLAGVVLAAVAVRFVFSATSVEGRNFWMIKSAPVDFKRFLWEKFFLYIIPLLVLAETLVVISNVLLGVDLFVMGISAGAIALMTVGLTGLGVGMGAMYPKFKYENVAEIAVTSGAVLYMIIAVGYAGLSVMLCSRPVYTHLFSLFTGRQIGGMDVWLSYVAMFAITAMFVYTPMKRGVRALENVEI